MVHSEWNMNSIFCQSRAPLNFREILKTNFYFRFLTTSPKIYENFDFSDSLEIKSEISHSWEPLRIVPRCDYTDLIPWQLR